MTRLQRFFTVQYHSPTTNPAQFGQFGPMEVSKSNRPTHFGSGRLSPTVDPEQLDVYDDLNS